MCDTGICKHEIQNGPNAGICSLPFGAELDCPEEFDDGSPICLLCGRSCKEVGGRWFCCGYYEDHLYKLAMVFKDVMLSVVRERLAVNIISPIFPGGEWCYFDGFIKESYFTNKSGLYLRKWFTEDFGEELADEVFKNAAIIDLSLVK